MLIHRNTQSGVLADISDLLFLKNTKNDIIIISIFKDLNLYPQAEKASEN